MTRADVDVGVWRACGLIQITLLLVYDVRGWFEHWMRIREHHWGVEFAVPWAHLLVPEGSVLALALTLLLGAPWLSRLSSGAVVEASPTERTPASALARHVISRLIGATCVFGGVRHLGALWPSIVYEENDSEERSWASLGGEWGAWQWVAFVKFIGLVLLGAILVIGPARLWRWARATLGPVPTHD